MRALSELLANPFEPVIVDRIDIDVNIEFRRDLSEIARHHVGVLSRLLAVAETSQADVLVIGRRGAGR